MRAFSAKPRWVNLSFHHESGPQDSDSRIADHLRCTRYVLDNLPEKRTRQLRPETTVRPALYRGCQETASQAAPRHHSLHRCAAGTIPGGCRRGAPGRRIGEYRNCLNCLFKRNTGLYLTCFVFLAIPIKLKKHPLDVIPVFVGLSHGL